MFHRNVTKDLYEALAESPVILLNGARQTGKSTLVQALLDKGQFSQYLTLDDPTVLAAVLSDPSGFISGLSTPVILDEIQRAPELFLGIKSIVDKNRKAGSFLLTGSANILLLPNLSETLAGRMEILTLSTLSMGERQGVREHFIDRVFQKEQPESSLKPMDTKNLIDELMLGGYPEVHARSSQKRRDTWFKNYLDTLLLRDVKELANIEGLKSMPLLVDVLAGRAGSLLNSSDVSRMVGVPYTTLNRYMVLLEGMFLVYLLKPWFSNKPKRLVKSPKVYLNDTGVLAYLRGSSIDSEWTADRDTTELGILFENFVVMELLKQSHWCELRVELYYFRTTHGNNEVDVVLESGDGRIVGIEIKARDSVSERDFKGMKVLAEMAGKKFHRGIVLYLGDKVVPFGENLLAVPVQALWEWGAEPVLDHVFK